MKVLDKIKLKLDFIQDYKPYDFTEHMGQLALEVNYTNGDKDMFTTPMDPNVGSDKGDFGSDAEFTEALNYLRTQGVSKKK